MNPEFALTCLRREDGLLRGARDQRPLEGRLMNRRGWTSIAGVEHRGHGFTFTALGREMANKSAGLVIYVGQLILLGTGNHRCSVVSFTLTR